MPQVIPRQLADNSGFDATDVLNKLRQKHALKDGSGRNIGIDVNTGGVAGVAGQGRPQMQQRRALFSRARRLPGSNQSWQTNPRSSAPPLPSPPGGVVDTYAAFVWEPALVKINAITAAAEAACLVLSVDETVRNPRSEAPDMSMGGMGGGPGRGRGGGMMPGRGRGRGMRR